MDDYYTYYLIQYDDDNFQYLLIFTDSDCSIWDIVDSARGDDKQKVIEWSKEYDTDLPEKFKK